MTSSMGRITSHIWNEKMQNVWHRQPGWVGCCCLGGCVFWKNVSRKIQNGSSSALCCCWLVLFVMKKTVRKKWSTSLLVGLVWFALVWLGLAGLVWFGLVWFGCFGLLVGWKNVGKNSKMVVPRLFVAVVWFGWFVWLYSCFGLLMLLVGWKNVRKNSKIVVPRLFVAVDCCCLVWKMFGKN